MTDHDVLVFLLALARCSLGEALRRARARRGLPWSWGRSPPGRALGRPRWGASRRSTHGYSPARHLTDQRVHDGRRRALPSVGLEVDPEAPSARRSAATGLSASCS
jgi:hypothetical protein